MVRFKSLVLFRLTTVQNNLNLISKKLVSTDRKIMDVDEWTKEAGFAVYDTVATVKQNSKTS